MLLIVLHRGTGAMIRWIASSVLLRCWICILHPEEMYGVRFELVQYDAMQGAGVCNVGKMAELPWFKG